MQNPLDEANVSEYLQGLGWLARGESVGVEPAGDGNINWVRRARARDGRSWILKQARPALERFPEYQASTERLCFEARYGEVTRPFDQDRVLPEVLHFDEAQRVLVLEDLGDAERLDQAFAAGRDVRGALETIVAFLARVHAGTGDPSLGRTFDNAEMRRLHGDHIFHLPYRENDFPLGTALRKRAEALWRDTELVERIDAAYARYLEPRGALVHADVQPGNVLLAERGPVLLDAEIAHVGDPAFDLGILVAHVLIAGIARREGSAAEGLSDHLFEAYREAHGQGPAERSEVLRYAGIEMLRRTLGAARVAVVDDEAAALSVVEAGIGLVRRA